MVASEAKDHRPVKCHWPLAEKRRIVELTLREGALVSEIARAHGVHPTSLSHWRSLYRSGALELSSPLKETRSAVSAGLLPVRISTEDDLPVRTARAGSQKARSFENGVVHLTLSSGAALRLEAARLDVSLLCALLAELR